MSVIYQNYVARAGQEFSGVSYADTTFQRTRTVLSDFRLGTPLDYFGVEGVVTVDSTNMNNSMLSVLLNNVYYNVSQPQPVLSRVIPSDVYTVLLSSRQTLVGVEDSNEGLLKPAAADYIDKWNGLTSFDSVYSNSEISLIFHYPT